jgi:hypothetical protein
VPVADGFKYLGVMHSPRLDANVARQLAIDTAKEILERVRAIPVGGDETRFLLEQVLWAKVGYRLRFDRFAIDAFTKIEQQVRMLLLHRGGKLNSRISKEVCNISPELGGPGILPWRDIVMADRLRLVQRHLDTDSTAAPSLRAAILRCQEKFGFETPVLQSTKAQQSGWLEADTAEHGWIESLSIWCAEQNIEIRGGFRLPGAATHDRSIVDLAEIVAPTVRRLLQRKSYEMDQHWASDYLLLEGYTANVDAVHFGTNRGKIKAVLRQLLAHFEAAPIPRFDGNYVKSGDVMFARSASGIQLVEVSSVSGSEVRATVLERVLKHGISSIAVGDRMFCRRTRSQTWQQGVVTARRGKISVKRPSGVYDDNIPCSRETICKFTTAQRQWCDTDSWTNEDSESTWMKSDQHGLWKISQSVRLPTLRQDISAFFCIRMNDTDYQHIATKLDALARTTYEMGTSTAHHTVPNEEPVLSRVISQLGHAPYLATIVERCKWPDGIDALRSSETLIASDGSYNCMGCGAWGLLVCTIDSVKCFAGRVDPGVGTNSPYRSEAYGLLAGLRYAVATDLKGNIRHIIDNKAVVQVFQDCEERGPSLVCSQDVWDEIIWYKNIIGSRYQVVWRRGHPEDRGEILHIEDRANHMADGLAAAGYGAAPDIRAYFRHGRRWHVRMGGLRHFDDIRSSARLHIGTQCLRSYYETSTDDGRQPDIGVLVALNAGKSCRSTKTRAESTKFIHRQLATLTRLKRWGFLLESIKCRACRTDDETIMHILIQCGDPRCVGFRERWFNAVHSHARKSAAVLADFLHRRLTMTSDGCLLYSGDACMALDFATGLFPTDFCIFLRDFAQSNEGTVRRFMVWFRRFCSRALWWPVWSAVSCPDNGSNDSNTSDVSGGSERGADDITGYCSDTDCSNSDTSDNDDDDDDGDDDNDDDDDEDDEDDDDDDNDDDNDDNDDVDDDDNRDREDGDDDVTMT